MCDGVCHWLRQCVGRARLISSQHTPAEALAEPVAPGGADETAVLPKPIP